MDANEIRWRKEAALTVVEAILTGNCGRPNAPADIGRMAVWIVDGMIEELEKKKSHEL